VPSAARRLLAFVLHGIRVRAPLALVRAREAARRTALDRRVRTRRRCLASRLHSLLSNTASAVLVDEEEAMKTKTNVKAGKKRG
jgi:hypothetical protein